eukprot:scaffold5102_cov50-Attheya_sp.AAC.1
MTEGNSWVLEKGTFARNEGAKWWWVLNMLDEDAEKVTIHGVVNSHKEVLLSRTHVLAVLRAYQRAQSPHVVVCCAPSESGKSVAAEYLLYGDHDWRPERVIMIQCGGMTDFPAQFAEQLGAPREVGKDMSALLVEAMLPSKDKTPTTAPNLLQKISCVIQKLKGMQCLNPSHPKTRATDNQIKLVGSMMLDTKYDAVHRTHFERYPLLILDDFNLQSEENVRFVHMLYTAANHRDVMVLIFTKNDNWAAHMIKIGSGRKIAPLVQNVDNTWDGIECFTEKPEWNDLNWTVQSLTDFARLSSEVDDSLDLDSVIIDNKMTPREARKCAVSFADKVAESANYDQD